MSGSDKEGVLIVGHGSRSRAANEVLDRIVDRVRHHLLDVTVEKAAMELSDPDIFQGIERLAREGVEHVFVVPLFLFPGVHIQNDIPQLLEEARSQYPELSFTLGDCIGDDERIAAVLLDRLETARKDKPS